jgi:TctA family transporter
VRKRALTGAARTTDAAAVRKIPVIEGLLQALTPSYMFWLTMGVMMGMVVGTLPGLTATMGTALLVPFTFALPTGAGLAMLGGLYVCAMFSDAIPAVLVNTPGTPSAMATGFDGHPMTQQGRAQEAIVAACFASALGTVVGATCYLLLAWPMISIALKFGPAEFFWLGIFALTIVGTADQFRRDQPRRRCLAVHFWHPGASWRRVPRRRADRHLCRPAGSVDDRRAP